MSAVLIIVIAIIVVAALAAAYGVANSRRRLRESFGPEFEQIVQDRGSTREADRELHRRKQEHAKLELRPLNEQDREVYLESWNHLQASFIDDPVFSMNSAEQLVAQALEARGYPGGDREEQLALLSVDHSGKLTDYRAAQQVKRQIEARDGAVGSTASTEDIRQALLSYRALFDELVAAPGTEVARPPAAGSEPVPAEAWDTRSEEPIEQKVER